MSSDEKNHDRQIEKTKKIILLVVIPLLITSTGLIWVSGWDSEPKPSYVEILSTIDLHCYNVNWFGVYGFQITYNETMEEIGQKFAEYGYDFTASEFFKNKEVENYFVVTCPHINSKLEAPEKYDPTVGIGAVDKCLQVKAGNFEFQDFCAQFIK